MASKIIGIDLGTTNSCVAVMDALLKNRTSLITYYGGMTHAWGGLDTAWLNADVLAMTALFQARKRSRLEMLEKLARHLLVVEAEHSAPRRASTFKMR